MWYRKIYLANGQKVYEHRLIASQMLGRLLVEGEVVHHLNGDILDNRPENLEVCKSHGRHTAQYHRAPTNRVYFKCETCGKEFWRWASRVRESMPRFCSLVCYWNWKYKQVFRRRQDGTFLAKEDYA